MKPVTYSCTSAITCIHFYTILLLRCSCYIQVLIFYVIVILFKNLLCTLRCLAHTHRVMLYKFTQVYNFKKFQMTKKRFKSLKMFIGLLYKSECVLRLIKAIFLLDAAVSCSELLTVVSISVQILLLMPTVQCRHVCQL